MLKTVRWCFLGLCMAFANAHSAPILQVDASGKLTGATGVDVGGTLYDVRFVDGTCVALFSGCDSVADFAFNSSGAAFQAASALLAHVFVDAPEGQFDSNPALTTGCEDPTLCFALTPFDITVPGVVVTDQVTLNHISESLDIASGVPGLRLANVIPQPDASITYAVWTPVPLPGTLWCLSLGLLALGLANRRRKFHS